jgi:hypothetical protein
MDKHPDACYIVVCNDDEGVLTLATRTAWEERSRALVYASTCNESRNAQVVECPRGLMFRFKARGDN